MERIHKDEQGNIISYENWKGEVTPAAEMTAYILAIQAEQLAELRKEYNNTCYNELLAEVARQNATITPKTNAYDIFRGQNLDTYVSNWAHKHNITQHADEITGMQKLQDFMYSYDHGFIHKAFDGRIADHLQSKFDSFYDSFGSRGVMPAFIAELDTENKNKLFSYIICK